MIKARNSNKIKRTSSKQINRADVQRRIIRTILLIGAIFLVKGASSLTVDSGYVFDLILLAASLLVIVSGPGKVSISHLIKKIPRFLQ